MKIENAVNELCRMGADSNITNAVLGKRSLCVNGYIRGKHIRVILKNGMASSIFVNRQNIHLAESLIKVIGQPRCEIRTFGS
jgi:predicted ATP-grasp superfamily ATP-dependent carboligase